ncbi:MAG: ABC-type dipeptide/oligopeptide/nickel transport system, permease component [Halorubrum sp. J07HR59]|jgi:ABC-type dipeptide/oligopeptide/nickel transport systems, permease components|nr:MAG: ABC-type dipeptide/oligopeptide/nickel transport system, permease component [Halorubrum sp. J07HR59]
MGRLRYLTKRFALALPVIWLGTSFTWFAIFMGPIDPAAVLVGQADPQATDQYQAVREQLGLTQPPLQQYLQFMTDMLTFDLGQTWVVYPGANVNSLVVDFLPQTIWLGLCSVAIAVCLGVPLGFYAGLRSNTFADYLTSVSGISWRAMPNFWLAAIFLAILVNSEATLGTQWESLGVTIDSVTGNPDLNYLAGDPLAFITQPSDTLAALKKVAPGAIVLGSASMGNEIRIGRTAVMEVKNKQYIDFARAKGVSGSRLVWKHVFRNALVPLVPIITTEAFLLIGGSVLVETVFGISGLGSLFFDAAINGDIPVMGTLMFVFILLLVSINLLQDVLYTVIDPRVGLEGDG